ncbi:MAG: DUF1294 domain-containing protein [Opitutae bacterium]|nr:DUF1294 domain-containing protein [Opitutae bacterium]
MNWIALIPKEQSQLTQILIGWFAVTSAWTFLLFGFDKWRAGRGQRVAESTLLWSSALGGWPGGLLGMIVFRHKSAKPSFQWKFVGTFLVWLALVAGALKLSGVI